MIAEAEDVGGLESVVGIEEHRDFDAHIPFRWIVPGRVLDDEARRRNAILILPPQIIVTTHKVLDCRDEMF